MYIDMLYIYVCVYIYIYVIVLHIIIVTYIHRSIHIHIWDHSPHLPLCPYLLHMTYTLEAMTCPPIGECMNVQPPISQLRVHPTSGSLIGMQGG